MRALRPRGSGSQITSEEMAANARNYVAPSGGGMPPASLDDYLVIEGLACTSADGEVFESYPVLWVRKDIFRGDDQKGTSFTPYRAIVHCEEDGLFLPSTALTCNILAYLYEHRSDEAVASVLQQYKGHGSGFSWHAQNTVVQWAEGEGKVIHYPGDADFPSHGGDQGINSERSRRSLPFVVENFASLSLEAALQRPHFSRFLQNLTGLADLGVLVPLGEYFSRSAKVWVPDNAGDVNTTRAAWVGCFNSNFLLYTYCDLISINAARGVGEPQASVSTRGAQ